MSPSTVFSCISRTVMCGIFIIFYFYAFHNFYYDFFFDPRWVCLQCPAIGLVTLFLFPVSNRWHCAKKRGSGWQVSLVETSSVLQSVPFTPTKPPLLTVLFMLWFSLLIFVRLSA